jgi:hypothetical protein
LPDLPLEISKNLKLNNNLPEELLNDPIYDVPCINDFKEIYNLNELPK